MYRANSSDIMGLGRRGGGGTDPNPSYKAGDSELYQPMEDISARKPNGKKPPPSFGLLI